MRPAVWTMALCISLVLLPTMTYAQTLTCHVCQGTVQPGGGVRYTCARTTLGAATCLAMGGDCFTSADVCVRGSSSERPRPTLRTYMDVTQPLRRYGIVFSRPSACEAVDLKADLPV